MFVQSLILLAAHGLAATDTAAPLGAPLPVEAAVNTAGTAEHACWAMLLMLYLPWPDPKPTPYVPPPPPPPPPTSGDDPVDKPNPVDPGGDPEDPHTYTHHPEPATLISGLCGGGMLLAFRWYRRRSLKKALPQSLLHQPLAT